MTKQLAMAWFVSAFCSSALALGSSSPAYKKPVGEQSPASESNPTDPSLPVRQLAQEPDLGPTGRSIPTGSVPELSFKPLGGGRYQITRVSPGSWAEGLYREGEIVDHVPKNDE